MEFFRYLFDVKPDCKSGVLMQRLLDACANNGQYAVEAVKMGENSLEFQVSPDEELYYQQSFLPCVRMRLQEEDGTKKLLVEFRLRKVIRIFLWGYVLALGLIELALLGSFFSGRLATPVLLVLPAGMGLFALLLSCLARIRCVKFFEKVIRRSL